MLGMIVSAALPPTMCLRPSLADGQTSPPVGQNSQILWQSSDPYLKLRFAAKLGAKERVEMEEMSDQELRGIILEELWKHRHKPLISFNLALKELSIPTKTKSSILRQLVSGGLIEYKLLPYSGLGSGEITLLGINVVERAASPPIPIVLHQHIQTGGIHFERSVSEDIEIGKNVSGVERMTVANDQPRISQPEKKNGALLGLIRKGWKWLRGLFGS